MQMTVKGCPVFLQVTGPKPEPPIVRYSAKYCQTNQWIKYQWAAANTHTCSILWYNEKVSKVSVKAQYLLLDYHYIFFLPTQLENNLHYKTAEVCQQSLFWACSCRISPSAASSASVEMAAGPWWQFSSPTAHFSLALYLHQERCSPEFSSVRGMFKSSHTAKWHLHLGMRGKGWFLGSPSTARGYSEMSETTEKNWGKKKKDR